MISLNSITLPTDMYISNLYKVDSVSTFSERTIGGRLVFSERLLEAGIPIDLASEMNFGWITQTVLNQLVALKIPGALYTLVYEAASYRVRFRFEDSPVLDFTPVIPRPNSAGTDYYYGTIRLITV